MSKPLDINERLALAEVEDRLRRVRNRSNWYTLQHQFYRCGALLLLSGALLVIALFSFSPVVFLSIAALLFSLAGIVTFVFFRLLIDNWIDLNAAARRIDVQVGLKERLSTLAAQLTSRLRSDSTPSRLWPHLLEENNDRLPQWEVKKVAPSRIPWSIFPFLAALAVALFIAIIPLLSSSGEPAPFSLTNLDAVLGEFPDRMARMFEQQMSLRPEPLREWNGKSILSASEQDAQGSQGDDSGRTRIGRRLALLSEQLQQALRKAFQGLPDEELDPRHRRRLPPQGMLLALKRGDPQQEGEADMVLMGENPLQKGEQGTASGQGQGDDAKVGNGKQSPAQGSGIQQLGRVRLGRKNARGSFQPGDPRGSEQKDQSGSGSGAGGGTDPRLLGDAANIPGGSKAFQLALDVTYKKGSGEGVEVEEEDDGSAPKSNKSLSQQQSLDDAIRKAQIPPEYEEIVKRLFSRGESQ